MSAPATMDFALVDQSGGAPTSGGQAMTAAVLAQIAAACEVALNRDVASAWGGAYRVRASDGSDLQPGEIVFALLPSLPDAPGAVAYHDVNGQGLPVAYDAPPLSDTLTGAGNSVSVAISHELAETAGDAGCNGWQDAAQGQEFARELCDAVESQSYPVALSDGTVIYVSNFLLPAFFVPDHAGPLDFLSTLGTNAGAPSAPFATAHGGYQIVRSSGSGETQVTASLPVTVSVSATVPFGRRLAKKRHWSSRAYRRGARS